MCVTGKIFNIQSFSVQDGPGIRTTVFFSGCHLRCIWCHNPESWKIGSTLRFNMEKCIGCGNCFPICPVQAHTIKDDVHFPDRQKCTACGLCADHCYAGALEITGKEVSAESVANTILNDKTYFANSGGGVTFSGGDCMLQMDFLTELLKRCKENNIHTAVDTSGDFPYEDFQQLLPYTDLFLYDIKASDPVVHKKLTGVDGIRIWQNLTYLSKDKAGLIVRVPCIKGANWEELPFIAERMQELALPAVELLPYHRLGEGKFSMLGQKTRSFEVPSNTEMKEIAALFQKEGRVVRFTEQ